MGEAFEVAMGRIVRVEPRQPSGPLMLGLLSELSAMRPVTRKKGTRTIGVRRQYTGTAGRTENSQVAVCVVCAGERSHRNHGCGVGPLTYPSRHRTRTVRTKRIDWPVRIPAALSRFPFRTARDTPDAAGT